MASVYQLENDGTSTPMARIRCKNEDRELQLILEQNPDLLPGDQIDPENPRRWLLIKREMPVPDPNTRVDRWSIDFMFSDQDAIPTFVECKRFEDTRARREVVGQMLEYAANGHHYWDKETLRDFADASARSKGRDLEGVIQDLNGPDAISTDSYFERLQQNLREGQLRIVFFLEDSSMELRSVVDFLNKQMERSEVLLVEARQFHLNGARIVVPTLFGYTDEARLVKRTVTVSTSSSRKKWDRSTFFSAAESRLSPDSVRDLATFLDKSIGLGCTVSWGSGNVNGSYSIKVPSICPRSIFSVFTDGRLVINFGWLPEDTVRHLRSQIPELVGLELPQETEDLFPSYPCEAWAPKVESLLGVLHRLIE